MMRGLWPAIRNVLSMRTRRPERRPASLPLVLVNGGVRRIIQLPPSEFPLYLPTPVLAPPGYVNARPRSEKLLADLRFRHISGPTFRQVAERYAAESAETQLTFSPVEFARTLAKIALCAGVHALGLGPFTHTPIRQVILGSDRNVGHWVGSGVGEPANPASGIHGIQVRASGHDIHAFIRLFAQFGAPEYHVVLGPADPEFANSEAWPWR